MNAINDQNNERAITGLESFVIGISPTFWTHVPLLVEHIKSHVHIVDGIQCIVLDENKQILDINDIISSSILSTKNRTTIIPLSKCTIVGTIVNVERKSNGCIMYVLDDGTGLIDIVHYVDDDFHSLPSILGHCESNTTNNIYEPGDLVRIMGRIKCVAIGQRFNQQQQPITVSVNESVTKVGAPVASNSVTICSVISAKSVTREIHATLIIPLMSCAITRSRALPHAIDQEYEHWVNCAQFLLGNSHKSESCDTNFELPLLSSALDVLPSLGADIFTHILESNSVPSAIDWNDTTNDDMAYAWRLFGKQCQCPDSTLKCQLLYCNCIASNPDVSIDPNFRYRNALLTKLLEAEAAYTATLPHPKTVDEIWNDIIDEVQLNDSRHFLFQYSSIVGDNELYQIAREETLKSCNNSETTSVINDEKLNHYISRNVQKLIRITIRALRNDGIIYLVDANTDTYMLISRSGVLEPYIRTKIALQKLSAESRARYYEVTSQPTYIKSIPRSRLDFVRRAVIAAMIAKN